MSEVDWEVRSLPDGMWEVITKGDANKGEIKVSSPMERNFDSEDSRKFWDFVEKTATEFSTWPKWMQDRAKEDLRRLDEWNKNPWAYRRRTLMKLSLDKLWRTLGSHLRSLALFTKIWRKRLDGRKVIQVRGWRSALIETKCGARQGTTFLFKCED